MSDLVHDPLATDCEHGYHAPLVAREPVDLGDAVNIDWACPACGVIEYTESWTKAGWLDHLAKARRLRAPKQARLG